MPSSKSAIKPKSSNVTEPAWQWTFEAIGTEWWIGLYDFAPANPATLQAKITALINEFDSTYSRFRPDSLVTKMSQQAGAYYLPQNAELLMSVYRRLYDCTDGLVTPLVGQLLVDTGYDATYSLAAKTELSRVPAWDNVLSVSGTTLRLTSPALLDFGAAGKGYLADLVADELQKEGHRQLCVDASGDMVCRGLDQPLRIGLEDPGDSTQALGVAQISNRALCGSAPNRRAWGDYHHIIDPQTKQSVQNVRAVWTVADTALVADAVATGLFFASPETLREQFEFEYVVVHADGSLQYSSRFPATLFTEESV